MSDKIPDNVAAHACRDEFEFKLFTLLQEYYGEDVGGTRSINQGKAVLALLPVISQMIAVWPAKSRRTLIKAFETGTNNLSVRLIREYEERNQGAPQ